MAITKDTDISGMTDEAVLAEFLPLIKSRASRFKNVAGMEADDLIQEGMIALLRAVRTYKTDSSASFRTYAAVCVENGMLSAVRRAGRKKDRPLNDSVDLSDVESEIGSESVEDMAIRKAEIAELMARIETDLSVFEKSVFSLYLEGCSYKTMAERLDSTEKAVDNALQRARRKLKSL